MRSAAPAIPAPGVAPSSPAAASAPSAFAHPAWHATHAVCPAATWYHQAGHALHAPASDAPPASGLAVPAGHGVRAAAVAQ